MHTHETQLNEYCSDENDNKGKKGLEQEEVVGIGQKYRREMRR